MRKFCFVMMVVAALLVTISSNHASAANMSRTQSVVSPYWQADTNSVYTFVAISVPSIASVSSRQITVSAVTSDSRSDTTASTFTVGKGSTAKVFISNTNHTTVNSNTVKGANWISVTGLGHVVINTIPNLNRTTAKQRPAELLSVWGAVVVPGGTGFAMEFIGDMTDSIGNTNNL
jgi:hypothetical protein